MMKSAKVFGARESSRSAGAKPSPNGACEQVPVHRLPNCSSTSSGGSRTRGRIGSLARTMIVGALDRLLGVVGGWTAGLILGFLLAGLPVITSMLMCELMRNLDYLSYDTMKRLDHLFDNVLLGSALLGAAAGAITGAVLGIRRMKAWVEAWVD